MAMSADYDTEWTIVSSCKSKVCKTSSHKDDIKFEDLVFKIQTSLNYLKRDIVACFIYGSRARRTNKATSDVDLLVFFKHEFNFDDLKEIKNQLIQDISIPVDFVACVHTKKWVEHTDQRDICYFEQLKPDAVQVIGTEKLSYLIDTSRKLGKVK